MDLHGPVRYAADHLGAVELRGRWRDSAVRPVVVPPCGFQQKAFPRKALRLALGEHCLDQLEVGEPRAPLAVCGGVQKTLVNEAFRHAHRHSCDVNPALDERLHSGAETLALDLAHKMVDRDRDTVEEDL